MQQEEHKLASSPAEAGPAPPPLSSSAGGGADAVPAAAIHSPLQASSSKSFDGAAAKSVAPADAPVAPAPDGATNGAAAPRPAPARPSVSPTPTSTSDTPLVFAAPEDVESPRGLEVWDDHKEPPCWDARNWNKGDHSNVATALILVLGVILRASLGSRNAGAGFILAFGLFGFAGGVTNWLAVKMLFDRIPLLIGSGVIPRRFRDILGALKTMILETFFEKRFLREYLSTRSGNLLEKVDVRAMLGKAMAGDTFDYDLARKLEKLAATPDGLLLQTMAPMFGGFDTMVPMLKPMLVGIGADLIETLAADFDLTEIVDVDVVRGEIDKVLTERMETLTPLRVKRMMAAVIREHLGWLVVWGNVFGGLIGAVVWACKFAATGEVGL